MPEPLRPLRFGEPLPLLHVASNRNERFALGSMGGRHVLLCVAPKPSQGDAKNALKAIAAANFDERIRVCAVVAPDLKDKCVADIAKTKIVFLDPKGEIAERCGFFEPKQDSDGRFILLDPTLRAVAFWPVKKVKDALAALAATPAPEQHAGVPMSAPVLIAPRVFEPAFCKELIAYYKKQGAGPSGVTKENADGKTFVALDDGFKRRTDCTIEDAKLREATMHRIFWRLRPEIEKVFMWRATRIERYIVACYDAKDSGHFKPHRDNTTKGTAHRRFAVTINLNAEEYEGGDLRFPEFGSRTYRAPTGGAVVFSCSLLHEATPVTRGRRFAFLPFLYDEAAAKIRAANSKFLDESLGKYSADGQ